MNSLSFFPTLWERYGKGKGFQFFATDREIYQWLKKFFQTENHAYILLGIEIIKIENKHYLRKPFSIEIDDYVEQLKKPVTRTFWIWPRLLEPSEFPNPFTPETVLSLNGFISINQGGVLATCEKTGQTLESSLGLVDRIINKNNGEVVCHQKWLSVYYRLKKFIQSNLIYSTYLVDRNGNICEEMTTDMLMSQGAYEAAISGEITYVNAPGKILEKPFARKKDKS